MVALPATGQSSRQVKVVLEFEQRGQETRQGAQGKGSVVIQDGKARGRGGVAVEDTTTRTTRTSGVFTVVQDGGTSSMMVASDVPYTEVAWFRDYATGQGYVAQGTAWQRVGTTLVVNPTILANGQIRVRLVPQVSYFTPEGAGSVEFTEASMRSGMRASLAKANAWRQSWPAVRASSESGAPTARTARMRRAARGRPSLAAGATRGLSSFCPSS